MTKKQTYRMLRRHGGHEAGAELQLTEDEASRINNESPGALEEVAEPAQSEGRTKPVTDVPAKPATKEPT